MNTPEQNEKNLFAMKKIIAEIVLALSIAWIGCWFIIDTAFYSVVLMSSALFVHLLRYFKVSIKFLYVLCTITLSIAILVTIFI
ncbi:hypothetical protein [Bacillus weihaiensis]|uniref:hypothetical protein n=1 Tax=Bacillus weihaiensis TaxID=1547283 RepID=UPI002352CF89|nr:hypothetical protein [Bacillus weihaiensis]